MGSAQWPHCASHVATFIPRADRGNPRYHTHPSFVLIPSVLKFQRNSAKFSGPKSSVVAHPPKTSSCLHPNRIETRAMHFWVVNPFDQLPHETDRLAKAQKTPAGWQSAGLTGIGRIRN